MDKYISNKIKNISLFMTFFVVILHSNNLEKSNVVNLNSVVQNFTYDINNTNSTILATTVATAAPFTPNAGAPKCPNMKT